jgi:pimeloyl-ACP methyl ester carboxylesterase
MKSLLALPALLLPLTVLAQNVKPIPPLGIEVPAADRAEIEAGLKELGDAIAALKKDAKGARANVIVNELPNVEIYHKAVDWALRYNEIFDAKQIPVAKQLLKQGLERVAALAKGEAPWNGQTGLVARAYRSRIDGSLQPYGVLIPDDWKAGDECAPYRLDFWCHGRNEKLSELSFVDGVQKNKGEFTPPRAIVCQLYGRFCNANKFAGEMDLFEVLEDIKRHYPIDEKRLVIRGFSMGGAACWQFATHYAGMWAAAAPGAGFAETAEFFKVFAPGKEAPPAWEQKLWRWYDCTTMAANLANTATVAYSGEKDGQKQAADIMIKYAEKEGITIPHIIGPDTAHKYHPESKPKINELVDAAVKKGNATGPRDVRFTTYTLIYPGAENVAIYAMEKQWERADVNVKNLGDGVVEITTQNVRGFTVRSDDGKAPYAKEVRIAGQVFKNPGPALTLSKKDGKWISLKMTTYDPSKDSAIFEPSTDKRPTVCGPIDHAFMSSFVFVRPTGKPLNDKAGEWAKAEMEHAIAAWRRVFRGDAIVMTDTEALNLQELSSQAGFGRPNMVLWGDVSSNKYLAKIAAKLPLKWDTTTLELGTQKVEAGHHMPILIYPDPLNPSHYVVLNSGFTFREFAALNNSDQTPKLPDWAVVDVNTPPGPKWPGKIVDAGFFDEAWKVPK